MNKLLLDKFGGDWTVCNAQTFLEYPYDFIENLTCHRELRELAVKHIRQDDQVLDLACGPGFLANTIRKKIKGVCYSGMDLSSEFVKICSENYEDHEDFSFQIVDMNKADLGEEQFDVIVVLNALYLAGINAVDVLQKIHKSLRAGGSIIVSGPATANGFEKAAPFMIEQLKKEGNWENNEEVFNEIARANAKLLPEQGNYWSAEGLAALLKHIGFSTLIETNNDIYYGFGFLVAARK